MPTKTKTKLVESQVQLKAVYQANRKLFDEYKRLQKQQEQISEELLAIMEENQKLEDQYELEQNDTMKREKLLQQQLKTVQEELAEERQKAKQKQQQRGIRGLSGKLWVKSKSQFDKIRRKRLHKD